MDPRKPANLTAASASRRDPPCSGHAPEGGQDSSPQRLRTVPDPAGCAELFRRYPVDPGIVAHGELTARVALLLARALVAQGLPVDVELVWAAALLHDVGKALDPEHHHVASRRIVEEQGWPALGPVVERHLTGLILTGDAPVTWEEKLVYYADKLCTTRVVSLAERVDDLCHRYPEHAPTFRQCFPAMRALEDEIFRQLPWGRDQLLPRLEAHPANSRERVNNCGSGPEGDTMPLGPPPAGSVRFMRLGHQCPWSHRFRHQCTLLATAMGSGLDDVDLTGRPGLAAPCQAYSSAQLVVPGYPPWPSPDPLDTLREVFKRPLPEHAVKPAPLRPPGLRQPVHAFRPEDGTPWSEAVAKTVRLCLGDCPASTDLKKVVAAKLAWLAGLASATHYPLVLLAGEPAVAFLELIPVYAAHVPLPQAGAGDLFLTCIHGTPSPQDARPWLLSGALAWLREQGALRRAPAGTPAVWAVTGRHAPYPNGPAGLFAAAGFTEVTGLGRIWLAGGWDELILVRWRLPNREADGPEVSPGG